jgi:hypothetical protein
LEPRAGPGKNAPGRGVLVPISALVKQKADDRRQTSENKQ